jgi:hypothetical protein
LTNLDPELNRASERFSMDCESPKRRAEDRAEVFVLMTI